MRLSGFGAESNYRVVAFQPKLFCAEGCVILQPSRRGDFSREDVRTYARILLRYCRGWFFFLGRRSRGYFFLDTITIPTGEWVTEKTILLLLPVVCGT